MMLFLGQQQRDEGTAGVTVTIEHCTITEMHNINHSNHLHLDVNDYLCQGSANLPH
jgi:hypothetical protein